MIGRIRDFDGSGDFRARTQILVDSGADRGTLKGERFSDTQSHYRIRDRPRAFEVPLVSEVGHGNGIPPVPDPHRLEGFI